MARGTICCVFERIYIHNYKCLVNFDLWLVPENVLLLGANGAGKTAVLDVMFGLRELLAGAAKITDRVAFHPTTLTRWQNRNDQLFEIDVRVDDEGFRYRLEIEHTPDGRRSRVVRETLSSSGTVLFSFEMGNVKLFRDDGSEGPSYSANREESALARVVEQPSNTRLTRFMKTVKSTVVCDIRPSMLGAESLREDTVLGRHAENFVNWYRHAVQENPASVRDHVEALRPVIDGFDDIHLQQSGLDSRALILDFLDGEGGADARYKLRFDELSDGQRVLVVLYALLHLRQPNRGIVLFVDEPDNFVALPEIQPWLMELVDLCETTPSQAVLCSHHPELIDYLGRDRGIVLRRGSSAVTLAQLGGAQSPAPGLKLSEQMARGRGA